MILMETEFTFVNVAEHLYTDRLINLMHIVAGLVLMTKLKVLCINRLMLTADELKYSNPVPLTGGEIQYVFKRAK